MTNQSLCLRRSEPVVRASSPRQLDGKFRNVVPREEPGFAKTLAIA